MRPADRNVRMAAGLILAAGLAGCGLAILAEELGVGAGAAQGVFTWKRVALLVGGAVTVAAGVLLLARPRVASRLIDWEDMGPLELDVRIVAAVILAAGLGASGLAILADDLGVGAGASQGVFTWKRIALLLAGGVAIAVGAVLLARPRIVSRLVRRSRIAAASARGSIRRGLVAAGFVTLLGVFGALGVVWVTDRLEASPPGVEAVPAELTPLEQWRVDAEHICKIEHTFQLRQIATRRYAPPAFDAFHHPRRLRDIASSISELRADLRGLGSPPDDVAAYRRLLSSLTALAAAYRTAAAAASDSGEEAHERVRVARGREARAERKSTSAAAALAIPSCGTGVRISAMVDGTCERHQTRLPSPDQATAVSDRPRVLRANASAISTLRRELRSVLFGQVGPPPPEVDQYSQLLTSLKRLAAALRATAAAADDGNEARERTEMNRVFAAAEQGGLATGALEVPRCGI